MISQRRQSIETDRENIFKHYLIPYMYITFIQMHISYDSIKLSNFKSKYTSTLQH